MKNKLFIAGLIGFIGIVTSAPIDSLILFGVSAVITFPVLFIFLTMESRDQSKYFNQ